MTFAFSDSARRILDEPHLATLATLFPDGSPQTSVVWLGVEGEEVIISSQRGRQKVKNIEADPRVSLSVCDPRQPDRYIEVRGTATVVEDTGRRTAVLLAEKYDGPGGGVPFLEMPPENVRVVLRIAPSRVTGYGA
ncbi:PPOX class F420-dependent oxidoreductase [Streptomyces amakusaensis]|uniref:PPOX class F420-dependent oxidoreductase n=1 Tax=Streptomyces amakusaensis TaxID=67271 RepID=A0ABW0APS1_9ACTN